MNGELRFRSDREKEHLEVEAAIRAMNIIQEVASNIDENTKITFDAPSKNEDNRVPILDLKVKVSKDNHIEYCFIRNLWQAK